jgi:hypothetical protein
MKDIKRIFVLASLFLPFLSAGAFGEQKIVIKVGNILNPGDSTAYIKQTAPLK